MIPYPIDMAQKVTQSSMSSSTVALWCWFCAWCWPIEKTWTFSRKMNMTGLYVQSVTNNIHVQHLSVSFLKISFKKLWAKLAPALNLKSWHHIWEFCECNLSWKAKFMDSLEMVDSIYAMLQKVFFVLFFVYQELFSLFISVIIILLCIWPLLQLPVMCVFWLCAIKNVLW